MAHAGNGNLTEAERLLRSANDNPMARDKVSKNLALVLKLQGRNAEAEAVSTAHTNAAGGSTLTSPAAGQRNRQNVAIRQSVQPTPMSTGSNRLAQVPAR